MTSPRDLLQSRRGVAVVVSGVALLFLVPRIGILVAREPFYDELFTQWITARSFSGIIEALRYDSGPPLYYFLVKILGLHSIVALRLFSLVCACGAFVVLTGARRRSDEPNQAGVLLAVYPPAVLFAADARAYAICGFFVACGVLMLDRGRPLAAAAMLVLAAYTHFYGVLFFPVLLLSQSKIQNPKSKIGLRPVVPSVLLRLAAFGIALVLFIPGFHLAWIQPREAIGWLAQLQSSGSHLEPLLNLSFAGRYPASLWPPAPVWIAVVALIALAAAAGRSLQFAAAVAVPLGLAVTLGLAGRGVYFPMRFESVIAVPLVLWCGVSLTRFRPGMRRLLVAVLCTTGAWTLISGISDHLRRPLDPYRAAALLAQKIATPGDTVVAVGYCYLEAVTHVRAPVTAFAPQQALHPGWRHLATNEEARALAESRLPRRAFLLLAETGTPELRAIQQSRALDLIAIDGRAIVARVRPVS